MCYIDNRPGVTGAWQVDFQFCKEGLRGKSNLRPSGPHRPPDLRSLHPRRYPRNSEACAGALSAGVSPGWLPGAQEQGLPGASLRALALAIPGCAGWTGRSWEAITPAPINTGSAKAKNSMIWPMECFKTLREYSDNFDRNV